MIKKSFRPLFIVIPAILVLCFFSAESSLAQQKNNPAKSFTELNKAFNKARALPCGQRGEALRNGREMVERFGNQTRNYPAVEYVKAQIPYLEIEEERCKNNLPETDLETDLEKYKLARKAACGQRDDAVRLAKYMAVKYWDEELNKQVIDFVKKETPKLESEEIVCKKENSLENLFALFNDYLKAGCGKRVDALKTGKKIIELHGANEANRETILIVEKEIPKIERQDYICTRNAWFEQSYKSKNWKQFLAIAKQIIAEEGDSPFGLDVMLTFAAVGHRLTAYDGENFYNTDTVFYAKKALDLIDAGTETERCWGVYECFKSKEKALGWLNYIVGYVSYFRLGEDKKAIPYFFKATQYKAEFKYDAFIYHAVAIHYFDRGASTASSLTINDFIFRANTLVNPLGEATGNTLGEDDQEITALFKNLRNLYNLRYNVAPDETIGDLSDYIQKLLNRPLIDPSAGAKKGKFTIRN